jgi:predicted RNase H-like HicB family nuclease
MMRIPVLVEPLEGKGYRARAGEPFALVAEGKSPHDAIQKVRKMIEEKVRGGAALTHVEIALNDNPMLADIGSLDPDDPMVQEWLEIMAENRRKADEDPDYL